MIGYGNSYFVSTILDSGAAPVIPPSNTVAPVISGTQVVGSTLSSTTGTWTGAAPITYTYQWYRGATLISGATSSTYTLVQADAGNTSNITCKVTGTNGGGSATATSNTLAQIFDFDANAFITAATITDSTQKAATNSLTINLKSNGIWVKSDAIYPMVGGTATTMKFNLKDPRDLDAAFRLQFIGGGTWSSTGYLPNGTNGYASTKLIPNNVLTLNNTHISLYSRTSTITNGARDLAAYTNAGLPSMALGTNTGVFISDQYDFNQRISSSIASATGFYIGSRTTSTSHKLYKNGSALGTNTNLNTQTLPPLSLFLGAANIATAGQEGASSYSNKEIAFASIGDGLTDTEAANFYTAVQAFQTALSRNV